MQTTYYNPWADPTYVDPEEQADVDNSEDYIQQLPPIVYQNPTPNPPNPGSGGSGGGQIDPGSWPTIPDYPYSDYDIVFGGDLRNIGGIVGGGYGGGGNYGGGGVSPAPTPTSITSNPNPQPSRAPGGPGVNYLNPTPTPVDVTPNLPQIPPGVVIPPTQGGDPTTDVGADLQTQIRDFSRIRSNVDADLRSIGLQDAQLNNDITRGSLYGVNGQPGYLQTAQDINPIIDQMNIDSTGRTRGADIADTSRFAGDLRSISDSANQRSVDALGRLSSRANQGLSRLGQTRPINTSLVADNVATDRVNPVTYNAATANAFTADAAQAGAFAGAQDRGPQSQLLTDLEQDASRELAKGGQLSAAERADITEDVYSRANDLGRLRTAKTVKDAVLTDDAFRRAREDRSRDYAGSVVDLGTSERLGAGQRDLTAQMSNQSALNQSEIFNADNRQQSNVFNAGNLTNTSLANAGFDNAAYSQNAAALNTGQLANQNASQFDASVNNSNRVFNAGVQNNANLAQFSDQSNRDFFNAGRELDEFGMLRTSLDGANTQQIDPFTTITGRQSYNQTGAGSVLNYGAQNAFSSPGADYLATQQDLIRQATNAQNAYQAEDRSARNAGLINFGANALGNILGSQGFWHPNKQHVGTPGFIYQNNAGGGGGGPNFDVGVDLGDIFGNLFG